MSDDIPHELLELVGDAIQNAWPSSGYESLQEARAKAAVEAVRNYEKPA